MNIQARRFIWALFLVYVSGQMLSDGLFFISSNVYSWTLVSGGALIVLVAVYVLWRGLVGVAKTL